MRTYAAIAVASLVVAVIVGAFATAHEAWHAQDWWTFANRASLGIATASAVGLVKAIVEWWTDGNEEEA